MTEFSVWLGIWNRYPHFSLPTSSLYPSVSDMRLLKILKNTNVAIMEQHMYNVRARRPRVNKYRRVISYQASELLDSA